MQSSKANAENMPNTNSDILAWASKKSTMSQCYETTIFTKKEGKLSIKRISSVHIQESGKDEAP